jgi:hypothetical protein
MDEESRKLQALSQAVHAAMEAIDELIFLLHSACASPEACEARHMATIAIHNARHSAETGLSSGGKS